MTVAFATLSMSGGWVVRPADVGVLCVVVVCSTLTSQRDARGELGWLGGPGSQASRRVVFWVPPTWLGPRPLGWGCHAFPRGTNAPLFGHFADNSIELAEPGSPQLRLVP
jgi:hypothetical protein